MLGHYLRSALGNLGRNWLYAAITMAGLAVGFAAAILIGLYVRDEFSFDRFLPGHARVFRVESELLMPGKPPQVHVAATPETAGELKLEFPQVQRAARLSAGELGVKSGRVESDDEVAWVDPDFFRILRFPALAGDLDAAMAAPDGLAITVQTARKYFGVDAPIGRTLQVLPPNPRPGLPPDEARLLSSFHPMRVLAVLKDPPSSSHLRVDIYASSRAAFSPMSVDERHPAPFNFSDVTYAQLKPGASAAAVQAGFPGFVRRHFPSPEGDASSFGFRLTPLADVHFSDALAPPGQWLARTGDRKVDVGLAAVGVLIVLIAVINFITLMTARAVRRAAEVGVRKAVGARRSDLVVQFMGEALIHVAITLALAAALAELLLPHVNGFLQRDLRFDYLADPRLAAGMAAGAAVTALAAGAYPALALSSFPPAAALKGGVGQPAGAAGVRQGLVVAQFAVLIGLMVVTVTIARQTRFALHNALRVDSSQVLVMIGPCRSAFAQAAAALAGVKAAGCASPNALGTGQTTTMRLARDRSMHAVDLVPLDAGFFEVHGLTPMAGRFFERLRGEDMALQGPDPRPDLQPTVVVNASEARELGYAKPADAVGQSLVWTRALPPTGALPFHPSRIVGVVGDFTLGSIRKQVRPAIYFVDPQRAPFLVLKLDGRRIPETLAAIDRLWRETGHDHPAGHEFESQAMQALYHDVIVQGVGVGACAGLAILIAALGLYGLAVFTTERRTKEIGVRKVMGATSADVARLLLWQFTQPVLWANLIAWPAAFWVMDAWLHGFAYRVDLPPWTFLAASVLAVVIAWAAVGAQAVLVARSRPVAALRYE
jgi:putative ABC transport system permease protein